MQILLSYTNDFSCQFPIETCIFIKHFCIIKLSTISYIDDVNYFFYLIKKGIFSLSNFMEVYSQGVRPETKINSLYDPFQIKNIYISVKSNLIPYTQNYLNYRQSVGFG